MHTEKLKNHLKKQQKIYIACGATAIVVGGGVYIWHLKKEIKALKSTAKLVIASGENNVAQLATEGSTIINVMRRSTPGKVIECIETGEQFASQARAAEMFGFSVTRLRSHLNGKLDCLDGLHFRVIGEL